ncbi:hypothetical protein ACFE04_031284 [Oxalis oulophora]
MAEVSDSSSSQSQSPPESSSMHREEEASTSQVRHYYEDEPARINTEVVVEEHNQEEEQGGVTYTGVVHGYRGLYNVFRDDAWSCIIVVFTFWLFVSMTLILGVYGAVSLQLGPHSSVLIEVNPIFVETVKVEQLNDMKPRPTLYGFYKTPPLNDVAHSSEFHNVSVNSDSHEEWMHYFNQGSQINISYSVKSPGSSILLVIAEGNEGLTQWLENPTYPNITLSWNFVQGSGKVQQTIYQSSSYYIAVGNLNLEPVEVELNIEMMATVYNTTEAYNRCNFANGVCRLTVLFPEGNSIVLTTPGIGEGTTGDGWYVKVTYGPRWLTYIVGIGTLTAVMLVAFNFLNKLQCSREIDIGTSNGVTGTERAPLLSNKDDDLSSWGSSYDSLSNEDEDLEEYLVAEGKGIKDGEKNSNNTRRLCAICFDAPRECFFLPCGHCVACFACGTRITEADGICPICRRNIKKVRKIFTV